jgi:hypothetical protein
MRLKIAAALLAGLAQFFSCPALWSGEVGSGGAEEISESGQVGPDGSSVYTVSCASGGKADIWKDGAGRWHWGAGAAPMPASRNGLSLEDLADQICK